MAGPNYLLAANHTTGTGIIIVHKLPAVQKYSSRQHYFFWVPLKPKVICFMNNQQENSKAISQERSWRRSSLLSCLEDEVYRPPPSRTQVETHKPPSKFEHGGSFNRRDNDKDSKQKELIWITISTAMKHFSIPKSISFRNLECNFLDRDDMPFQKSIDNLMKGEERRAMNIL